MYTQKLFLGLTAYDILICVGIIVCFATFGYLADKRGIRAKVQNFALICGVAAIGAGLGSAVLFQALYNIKTVGKFEIARNTGMTFYGGLIGGVAIFLALWFIAGRFVFKNGENKKSFFTLASCAVPAIAIAHSFGRVGCLMAGCCHGELTDKWYGIMMHGNFGYDKYVPTQLFEAIFLLGLFTLLARRALLGKRYNLPLYMCAYAVWRFALEFLRGDYRGSSPFEAVSPSQFIAILMVLGSVGVFFLEKYISDRQKSNGNDEESLSDGQKSSENDENILTESDDGSEEDK